MDSASNHWAYLRPVLWLCSPRILCFITFFFAFPLDRRLPFSTYTRMDAMFVWSFIAPLFTLAAIVILARRPNRRAVPSRLKIATWSGIGLIVVINVFPAVGFWAAAYF
jgi:xanthine/uracil/vitamin C permease (AzgA family)